MTEQIERLDTVSFERCRVHITTDAGRSVTVSRRAWNEMCEWDNAEWVRMAVVDLVSTQELGR